MYNIFDNGHVRKIRTAVTEQFDNKTSHKQQQQQENNIIKAARLDTK